MASEEQVDGGQKGVAEAFRLAGRAQDGEQRRQEGEREHEGDHHALARDLAEFGDAFVIRGQEGEEPGGDACRGQSQRTAGLRCSGAQGGAHFVGVVAFGAVAHAELDAEIRSQADEEHGEGDRDQVERAHCQQPGRRRDGQPGDQVQHHGEHDAARAQCEPQDEQHGQRGADAVERGAAGERGELLVIDRRLASQA